MPNIAELREIDGALWARIPPFGDTDGRIQILSDAEITTNEQRMSELLTEIERLRAGLDAAIRAANLALFVIRKQGVMPNSSWESGFNSDLAKATAARGDEQDVNTK